MAKSRSARKSGTTEQHMHLAILGCGSIAHLHADNINRDPRARVVALADESAENIARLQQSKFKGDSAIRSYDSMEKLLLDPPEFLDGIIIATPHTLHFKHCVQGLEAGYDVLVEKPMVTSSDHARRLVKTIEKTGRQLQVAFQAPFSQEFAYIRQLIKDGGLGELQTVSAFSHQGWRPRDGKATTWRHDPALSGGGQMYDTGAHLFNSIAWLIDRPVKEVFCWLDKKGMAVDINATCSIKWEGGVLGAAIISGNNPGWSEGIWIAGDRGRVATGIHGGRLEQWNEQGGQVKYPPVTQKALTPLTNFIDVFLGLDEPRCPVRYGVLHSWLMDALYESAEAGAPVKLSKPPL